MQILALKYFLKSSFFTRRELSGEQIFYINLNASSIYFYYSQNSFLYLTQEIINIFKFKNKLMYIIDYCIQLDRVLSFNCCLINILIIISDISKEKSLPLIQ